MLTDHKIHDTLICPLFGETKIQRIQNHRVCKPSQQAACNKTQWRRKKRLGLASSDENGDVQHDAAYGFS